MKKTVVITDHAFKNIDQEKEVLEKAGHRIVLANCVTESEVLSYTRNADALLVQCASITGRVIRNLKKCKVIVRYGIGVDNVDLDAALQSRIPICNVPDYGTEEVAAHTIALTMAMYRQLFTTDSMLRLGVWKFFPPGEISASRETVFSILGLGRIARSVVQKAQVLGFRTAAYDPYVGQEEMKALGVRKITFPEALRESDILSLHMPLTNDTRHIINSQTLSEMKAGALLINTSRGGLINTLDLANALKNKSIGGAALDVFEKEPLEPDHPIRNAPNTILTSHTAWYSERSIHLLQRRAAEEVHRALAGYPLQNRVV